MIKMLTISKRLSVGFGIFMLIISVLCACALYSAKCIETSVASAQRSQGNERFHQQIYMNIFQAKFQLRKYLETDSATSYESMQEAFKTIHEKIGKLSTLSTVSANHLKLEALDGQIAAYEQQAATLKNLMEHDIPLRSWEAAQHVAEIDGIESKIDFVSRDLSRWYEKEAVNAAEELSLRISATVTGSIFLGVISLLTGAIVSVAISDSITAPLASLTTAMVALSKGDLTVVTPEIRNVSELDDMAKAIPKLKDALERAERMSAELSAERSIHEARAHIVKAFSTDSE